MLPPRPRRSQVDFVWISFSPSSFAGSRSLSNQIRYSCPRPGHHCVHRRAECDAEFVLVYMPGRCQWGARQRSRKRAGQGAAAVGADPLPAGIARHADLERVAATAAGWTVSGPASSVRGASWWRRSSGDRRPRARSGPTAISALSVKGSRDCPPISAVGWKSKFSSRLEIRAGGGCERADDAVG
jgi:hypothetical protein